MAYNPGGSRSYGGGGHGHGGGGRRFGGGGGHGGGHGGPRRPMEMHQTTCSECGKSCEVPFRPSGTKPVFCSNCFKGKNNDGDRGVRDSGGGRRSYGDRDYSDRPPVEMHQAICSDCGKDCEVPFKPTGDKPIYCEKCFGRNKEIKIGKSSGGNNADFNAKFEMINIKLDRILKALDNNASKTFARQSTPVQQDTPRGAGGAEAAKSVKATAAGKTATKKVKSGKTKNKKTKI
ncbi:hypothetical protein HZA40_03305 [Candidatus Peregrinibacteria bacterium]|nr:hypothetical protein [Candidatus Peregrinibacteria bacterium]